MSFKQIVRRTFCQDPPASHHSYSVRAPSFFDVVRRDYHRGLTSVDQASQMFPNTNTKHFGWVIKRVPIRQHSTYLRRSSGSTPTVGSSRIKSCGLCSKATAKEVRLCCPPLNWRISESSDGSRRNLIKKIDSCEM